MRNANIYTIAIKSEKVNSLFDSNRGWRPKMFQLYWTLCIHNFSHHYSLLVIWINCWQSNLHFCSREILLTNYSTQTNWLAPILCRVGYLLALQILTRVRIGLYIGLKNKRGYVTDIL